MDKFVGVAVHSHEYDGSGELVAYSLSPHRFHPEAGYYVDLSDVEYIDMSVVDFDDNVVAAITDWYAE